MTCLEIQEFLSPYLDEALDAEELHFVEKHLAACSTCRDELAFLEQTVRAIRSMGEIEPPPDFSHNLQQRLRSTGIAQKKSFYRTIGHWNWMPFGAAAALLVIMLLSWNVFINPAPYMLETAEDQTLQGAESSNQNSRQTASPELAYDQGTAALDQTEPSSGTGEKGTVDTNVNQETRAPSTLGTIKAADGTGSQEKTSNDQSEVFSSLSLSDKDQPLPNNPDQPASIQNVPGGIAKSAVVTMAVLDLNQTRQKLKDIAQQHNGTYSENGEAVLLSVAKEKFDSTLAALAELGKTEIEIATEDLTAKINEVQSYLDQLNEKLNTNGKSLTKEELDRLEGDIKTQEVQLDALQYQVAWSKLYIGLQSNN